MTQRFVFVLAAGLCCGLAFSCGSSRTPGDDDDSGGSGNGSDNLDPSHLQSGHGDDTSQPVAGHPAIRRDGGTSALDGGIAGSDGGPSDTPDGGADGTDAGDAGSAGCELDMHICGASGRRRCNGQTWVSDPCPLDTPTCEDGACMVRGPSMVHVGTFYIDSTEVTVADYVAFLDAKDGDTSGQPDYCSWNTELYDGTPSDPDNWPITNVDFCDAWAYCDWAGKRLCGAIEGGAVADADALDPAKSQWSLACGGNNGGTHPNNNADCNSSGGTDDLKPVGSLAGCEGFYPGVFDMEGNAAEWVDACDVESGATDTCHLLGGSYIDNQSYCTESFDEPRNTTASPFGFRCCSG